MRKPVRRASHPPRARKSADRSSARSDTESWLVDCLRELDRLGGGRRGAPTAARTPVGGHVRPRRLLRELGRITGANWLRGDGLIRIAPAG